MTFDLLRDDWKGLARSICFDWLNYLNSHSQINPKIVPLLLDKIKKILETSDPDDRLLNLIPALIRLNPAAFDSLAISLLETFLKILIKSPGAATPISALVKSCQNRKNQVEKIQVLLMQSIENAPADNRWIVITCLRAVNILIPFYFNLGENREKGLITDIFNYGSKYTIDQISGQLW